MNLVSSPALRPSHPHGCRKRSFGQGHALSGRFAGLDRMTLLSGYGCLRATDEEASGGGFVKGSSQARSTKATIQETCSRLSRFSRIPTCGDNNTCKAAPACAPQSSPHTYAVTARPAFRWPRHHARHADHNVSRILIERFVHGVQSFAAYRLLMCRMFIWSRQYTHQRHAGYSSAPRPIRIRHILDARIMRPRFCADACSFVRHCLRGPAYVSSIRCAYSLTAGKGPCPFEPRKGKRQERQ